jgi:hypothetical protein
MDCPRGFFSAELGGELQEVVCENCPAGRFGNDVGGLVDAGDNGAVNPRHKCKFCPIGYYQNEIGSIDVTECKIASPGKYAPALETLLPSACPQGYVSDAGAGGCDPCEPGTYQPQGEQRFCLGVDEGYYVGVQGGFAQIKCPRGKHGRSGTRSDCIDCPTGRYNDVEAIKDASLCKLCIAGTYNSAEGIEFVSECKSCPEGRYSPNKGNVVVDQCLQCDAGLKQPLTGQSACVKCEPGRFGIMEGGTACDACAVGRYQSIPASKDCINCDKGLYQEEMEMGECKLCQEGYFQEFQRRTGCDACPKGYYGACDGLSACLQCPPGQTTYTDASVKCTSKVLATVIPEFLDGDRGVYVDESDPHRVCANWLLPETHNEAELPRTFDHILFQVSYDKEFPPESTNTSHPRLKYPLEPWHVSKNPGKLGLPGNETHACTDTSFPVHMKVVYVRVRGQIGDALGSPSVQTPTYAIAESCGNFMYLCRRCHKPKGPGAWTIGGAFNPVPSNWICQPCPTGAVCDGPVLWDEVYAKYGFMRLNPEDYDDRRKAFWPCFKTAACLGGKIDMADGEKPGEKHGWWTGPYDADPSVIWTSERCGEDLDCSSFASTYPPAKYIETGLMRRPAIDCCSGVDPLEEDLPLCKEDPANFQAAESYFGEGALFVSNLGFSTTEDDLMSAMEARGFSPVSAVVTRSAPTEIRPTITSLGWGTVYFQSNAAAAEARELLRWEDFEGGWNVSTGFSPSLRGCNVDLGLVDDSEQCHVEYGHRKNCSLSSTGRCRLCRACGQGYWAQGVSSCYQCPHWILNIVLVVLAVGFVLLMLGMFLSTALEDSGAESDSTVIHFSQAAQKILLNHVQLISLGSGFPLKWPEEIMSMFEVFSVFGNAGSYVFNPACNGMELVEGASMFFQKQLGILMLPFIAAALCALFWWFQHCKAKICPADARLRRKQRKLQAKRVRALKRSKTRYERKRRKSLRKLKKHDRRIHRARSKHSATGKGWSTARSEEEKETGPRSATRLHPSGAVKDEDLATNVRFAGYESTHAKKAPRKRGGNDANKNTKIPGPKRGRPKGDSRRVGSKSPDGMGGGGGRGGATKGQSPERRMSRAFQEAVDIDSDESMRGAQKIGKRMKHRGDVKTFYAEGVLQVEVAGKLVRDKRALKETHEEKHDRLREKHVHLDDPKSESHDARTARVSEFRSRLNGKEMWKEDWDIDGNDEVVQVLPFLVLPLVRSGIEWEPTRKKTHKQSPRDDSAGGDAAGDDEPEVGFLELKYVAKIKFKPAPTSPAGLAGIHKGDILRSINGHPVCGCSFEHFKDLIKSANTIGEPYECVFVRKLHIMRDRIHAQVRARMRANKDSISTYDKFAATMITTLYLMYPTITRATFQLVACQAVGSRFYLQMDLDIRCYEREHLIWLINLFVPGLLGYVVGMPLATLLVLVRNRDRLENRLIRFRYGVLFSGYSHSCYYWEVVIALRKALVITVSVFLTTAGAESQALCAMMIIMASTVFHMIYRPFDRVTAEHDTLYWAEFLGLQTAFLTFWTGLFFYQEIAQIKWLQYTFTFELLSVNVVFLLAAMRWYFILKLMDLGDLIATKKLQGFSKDDLRSEIAYQAVLSRFLPNWQIVKNLWARRAWQQTAKDTILENRTLDTVSTFGTHAHRDHRFELGTTASLHHDAIARLGLGVHHKPVAGKDDGGKDSEEKGKKKDKRSKSRRDRKGREKRAQKISNASFEQSQKRESQIRARKHLESYLPRGTKLCDEPESYRKAGPLVVRKKKRPSAGSRLFNSKRMMEKVKVSASATSIQKKHEESVTHRRQKLKRQSSNSHSRLKARIAARKKAKASNGLKTCKVFSSVREGSRNRIIDAMELESVPVGKVICQEGDTAEKLYLILSGTCIVTKNSFGDKRLAVMGEDTVFGESALLKHTGKSPVRTATVTAESASTSDNKVSLLSLSREKFSSLVESGVLSEKCVKALRDVGVATEKNEKDARELMLAKQFLLKQGTKMRGALKSFAVADNDPHHLDEAKLKSFVMESLRNDDPSLKQEKALLYAEAIIGQLHKFREERASGEEPASGRIQAALVSEWILYTTGTHESQNFDFGGAGPKRGKKAAAAASTSTAEKVEGVRRKLIEKIKKYKNLLKLMKKLDVDASGKLSKLEFQALLVAILGAAASDDQELCDGAWAAVRMCDDAQEQDEELDAVAFARWLGMKPKKKKKNRTIKKKQLTKTAAV